MKLSRIIFVLTLLLLGAVASDAQAGFVFSNSSKVMHVAKSSAASMSASESSKVEEKQSHYLDVLFWFENAAENYAWGHQGTTSTTGSSVSQSQTNNVPATTFAETPRTSGSLITKIAEEPVPQSRYMPTSLFRPPRA